VQVFIDKKRIDYLNRNYYFTYTLRGPNYYLSNKTIANNRYEFLSRKIQILLLLIDIKKIKAKLILKDKKLFPINEK
jgi:hypothetical protein